MINRYLIYFDSKFTIKEQMKPLPIRNKTAFKSGVQQDWQAHCVWACVVCICLSVSVDMRWGWVGEGGWLGGGGVGGMMYAGCAPWPIKCMHCGICKVDLFSFCGCMQFGLIGINRCNNNNNNEHISRAPFHVKHAQLRWTGANTKIQNACI